MRPTLAVATLLSLSTFVAAQGYGRFSCTIVNGDKTFSPDQSQCANDALVAPGSGDGSGQGDNPNPVDPECTQDAATGRYYCGIQGAACTDSTNCDNGSCQNGVCTGGPGTVCNGDDAACSGFLYCTDATTGTTGSDTCGGIGSYCQDPTQGAVSNSDAQNSAIFSQYCASGYCNLGTAQCDVKATAVGDDCSTDTQKCGQTSTGQSLTCDESTQTCKLAAVPSSRARARRNLNLRSAVISHTLENCGGVDCTALPGVASVSCITSSTPVCEIWACADGFAWDAATQSCLA
ncbi:hypothetical protein JCM11491_001475 [Sporobolomyces phaffii]